MGYTTIFDGYFTLNKPLSNNIANKLKVLSTTRRMQRNVDILASTLGKSVEQIISLYGLEGEFYDKDDMIGVVNCNKHPSSQPGLWCNWEYATEPVPCIRWDTSEKFYNYIQWLAYIIDKLLSPNGYILNGRVSWSGEERFDNGYIIVIDNIITLGTFH